MIYEPSHRDAVTSFVNIKGPLNSNYKPTKNDPPICEGYLVIYSHLLISHNMCNGELRRALVGARKH